MTFAFALAVIAVSGLYTSLWGAFKDSPFERFKPATFPRSIYFSIAIFLALYFLPFFRAVFQALGLFQLFFLVMGVERFLAELLLFRTEDQAKYFVPSHHLRQMASDLPRYLVGTVLVLLVLPP
jgi:hypothetical protein